MGKLVRILGMKVPTLFYKGRPVVTLRQIDALHKRPSGTARQSFNRHRKQMIDGRDYFDIPYEEWGGFNVYNIDAEKRGWKGNMIFLTESGYVLVTKPFNDDLAWALMRELVESYFRKRQAHKPPTEEEKAALNVDILLLGTKQTALKHGRSESFVKKHTKEIRANRQMELQFT